MSKIIPKIEHIEMLYAAWSADTHDRRFVDFIIANADLKITYLTYNYQLVYFWKYVLETHILEKGE